MTIKHAMSEYVLPLIVAAITSASIRVEGVLLKIFNPMDFALEQVIHVCTAISAILGVTYLSIKVYFLIKNKGESE